MSNGKYNATIIKVYGGNNENYPQYYNFEMPGKPEKLFCGDFNNDGLTDILVLHKDGYKIFYNLGGEVTDSRFSNSKSKIGTTLKDQRRVDQGDFNGDGLPDFVYNVEGEASIWVAFNNGDGTFRNVSSGDLGLSPKIANEPDGHFTLRAIDMNRDGRSDILICKATYELNKLKQPTFKETQVKWLQSNGSNFRVTESYTKTREADAEERLIFLGDFDGDGNIDLANYGSALDKQDNTFTDKSLYLYHTQSVDADAATGRLVSVTDGLGNKSDITYSYLTSPNVYSKESHMEDYHRVNTVTLPLPVVKRLSFTNGICRSNVIDYTYKDLLVEMTGAGVLGFSEVTKTMVNTGETSTDAVTDWNVNKWIPKKTKSINTIDGLTSTVETEYMIQDVGKTYFVYEGSSKVSDMYGNKAMTVNTYDLDKGVILTQTVNNEIGKMYKKVSYSAYQQKSGVWLPTIMKLSQKHEHDSKEYSTETKFTYNDKGNVLSTTVHNGTDMALTTTATYDEYGNRLSSYSTGNSVVKIIKYNEYDPTGRFIVKSWQNPEAAINTFTYDIWGNVLTENDCTNPSNILTTTHTYDNWGRLISTTIPDGTESKYSFGWGKTSTKHHYSFVETTGKPWVLTWFDSAGNETSTQTFGPKRVLIAKTTEYDSCGRVKKISSQTGKLKTWQSFLYDNLGRVITEKSSIGSEVSYSYANRSVTTSTNGRIYTKLSDAWGNLLSSTDPSGATVTYKYGSNGQPSSVTTDGSTVTMTYDCAGNKISMSDPDAGSSSYEYAADGSLLKHTDAKGVVTENKYDALGRLLSIKVGNQTIVNSYGSSGNEKLLLIKKTLGQNTITYSHDNYGRIKSEVRNIQGSGNYTTLYNYDSNNRLSRIQYPGALSVAYSYDDYGFKTSVTAAGKEIYRLQQYDGQTLKTSFMDSIIFSRSVNSKGLERIREVSYGGRTLDRQIVDFDTLTLNLRSRERMGYTTETFQYDNLDRLIGGSMGAEEIMKISYARNGNILSKSGLGAYGYDNTLRPHAVTSVENSGSAIPSSELLTTFNDFGLIDKISDTENNKAMMFMYGPDMKRAVTTFSEGGKVIRTTTYLTNLEMITENGMPRHIYYVDDNVIFINSPQGMVPYFLFKDHLGSILSAFNGQGSKVFEASYDAWGKQNVKRNIIGLTRGYTGHEMLNEFGIINMNGRLYDPELGRFFSPDPFVQFPDFSQSYNRYSYCLNNPLKYNDPTGHLLPGLAEIVGVSLFYCVRDMLHAKATGGNIIKAGLASLLTSRLCSFGIGKLYKGCGSIGKEVLRASTHGLSRGLANMLEGGNFGSVFSNFMTGAASAIATSEQLKGLKPDDLTDQKKTEIIFKSALTGGLMSFFTGGNFLKGALIGYNITLYNYLEGEKVNCKLPENNKMEIEEYVYYSGNVCAMLPVAEVVKIVLPPMVTSIEVLLNTAIGAGSNINTGLDCFGNSLMTKGANSTMGNNMQIYWKTSLQRPFYGNQYVSTKSLTSIGGNISRFTKAAGKNFAFLQIGTGLLFDAVDLCYTGQTDGYNSVHATFSWASAWGGMKLGFSIGGFVGSSIGGVGAIPLSIICGTICGTLGGIYGGEFGGQFADWLYGK